LYPDAAQLIGIGKKCSILGCALLRKGSDLQDKNLAFLSSGV